MSSEKSANVSLTWAFIILSLGVVCQLAELDIISYRDVTRLWPVILIGFGAKFIYDYTKNKEGGRNE